MRPDAELLVIDKFSGINSVVDGLKLTDDLVPWCEGAFFNNRHQLERVRGKLLVSSSTSIGRVLLISQLEFRDTVTVCVHHASTITVDHDLTVLQTTLDTSNPLVPVILC